MENRREFLKFLGAAGAGLSSGISALNAGESDRFGDYKAIVFLYLEGGNDGLNTFPPVGTDSQKGIEEYRRIRNNIRIENKELNLQKGDEALDLSGGNPYEKNGNLVDGYTKGYYRVDDWDLGFNALMPELAHLARRGKVALFANMGNIIEPASADELHNQTKPLPPFLYAHNHQTKLTQNGEAALLDYTGWAGRVADLLGDVNGGSVYGINIAITRDMHLFDGNSSSSLVINANGPSQYWQLRSREVYNKMIEALRSDMLEAYYARKRKHSFWVSDSINEDWNKQIDWSSRSNAYGGELFSIPSNQELSQKNPVYADKEMLLHFKAVARLAYIGKSKGLKRQIFSITDGGYDTHNNQSHQHARKLRGLSLALGDFYKALEAMEMENDVLVISASDFGRSTGNNGDGTDHAWGGNYFALGGAIRAGVYGKLPVLTLGGKDDFTKKGRLVPTTSFTQYYATAAKWFGLTEKDLDVIFPELKNFSQKDLGYIRKDKS